nr:exportin-2 [Tanacetum cinerariifolium]
MSRARGSHIRNVYVLADYHNPTIVSCLALFDENPAANWRYKECAIYLVDSLGNRVADVESFFRLYIVPELESQDVNAFPMLKAASLKFLTTFLRVFPKHLVMAHLDNVARFFTSDFNAVHYYVAYCIIHKLLLVKERYGLERYHIWASLFNHLQNCRPPSRFVICLVKLMSRFLVKDGVQTLVDSINSVQANFFDYFLAEFWILNVKSKWHLQARG